MLYCSAAMELYSLQVFLTVATEKSFSRAAEKLLRTQPAISLALQRLEQELGEKLIDRSGKDLILTDAGRTVLEYARRFQSLQQEMDNSLAELRDNSAGRLTIGANESTTLYLLQHIEQLPRAVSQGEGAGAAQPFEQDPQRAARRQSGVGRDQLRSRRRAAEIQGDLHRLAGVRRVARSTAWRSRKTVSITELGSENFIAHNVLSPYRDVVLREFQTHKVPLHMEVEMPTIETIRKLVQNNVGVAFLPRMCVEQEIEQRPAVRSAGEGDARGAQDPPDLSDAPRAQPRGQSVPGSRGIKKAGRPEGIARPSHCNCCLLLNRHRHVGLRAAYCRR